jgi:tRNA nucleotidyltransferase/poly(A) polymerase
MLRLARFMGRGYKAEKNTVKLVLRSKKYLKNVSVERIREELLCILNENQPSISLKLLLKWGISDMILPGIKISSQLKNIDKAKGAGKRLYSLLSGLTKQRRFSFMNSLKLQRTLKNEVEILSNKVKVKPVISGSDLIELGYKPGPVFKEILNSAAKQIFDSRQKALRFVIDNYPEKR